MMGAGPFSFASSSAASQPATAISRETSSVNLIESSAPYFMPRQVMVLPRPEESHAMAALAQDFVALLLQRQAIDLADVVEHAREHLHDFAVLVPVELGEIRERVLHEAREIDRAQQARAIRRQRLLAAVVRMQAVGVELVDARDLHVVDVFEAIGAHAVDAWRRNARGSACACSCPAGPARRERLTVSEKPMCSAKRATFSPVMTRPGCARLR